MAWVLVRFFLCISCIQRMLWLVSCSARCPCYSFHIVPISWQQGDESCRTRNGRLVSMETLDEWNFINNEVQRRNKNKNEWYIGLRIASGDLKKHKSLEEKRKANWRWTSGERLKFYNKWQTNEPNNDVTPYGAFCVVMAKNYPVGTQGLFKDVFCGTSYPFICEYDDGIVVDSSYDVVCWDKSTNTSVSRCPEIIQTTTGTTTNQLQTTERTTSTQSTMITRTTLSTFSATSPRTVSSTIQTTANVENDALQTGSKPFPYWFIIVILAVILVLLIGLFIAMCCWIKKKRAGGKMSTNARSSSKSRSGQQTDVHSSKDLNGSPYKAQILSPDTVIYAEVNDQTALYPTPTDVPGYLAPVDSPTSPPPLDLYSSIDHSQGQRGMSCDIQGSYRDQDRLIEHEYTNNKQPTSHIPDVYAVVDKSKKSKGKAEVPIVTAGNNLQNSVMSADQISPADSAMYAVVDKSKKDKGKKAGVTIGTDDNIGPEVIPYNDPNEVLSNQNPADSFYEVIDNSNKIRNDKRYETLSPETRKNTAINNVNEQQDLESMYAQVDRSQKTKK